MWAIVSAVLVLQPGLEQSYGASATRFVSNLIGALTGAAVDWLYGHGGVDVIVALVLVVGLLRTPASRSGPAVGMRLGCHRDDVVHRKSRRRHRDACARGNDRMQHGADCAHGFGEGSKTSAGRRVETEGPRAAAPPPGRRRRAGGFRWRGGGVPSTRSRLDEPSRRGSQPLQDPHIALCRGFPRRRVGALGSPDAPPGHRCRRRGDRRGRSWRRCARGTQGVGRQQRARDDRSRAPQAGSETASADAAGNRPAHLGSRSGPHVPRRRRPSRRALPTPSSTSPPRHSRARSAGSPGTASTA